MPYEPTDPRAQLATVTSTVNSTATSTVDSTVNSTVTSTSVPGVPRAATYRELRADDADETHPGGSTTWWTRSQAMVVAHTAAVAGDTLTVDTTSEHVLLLLDGAAATVSSAAGDERVDEDALIVVPAGASTATITSAGIVVRLFAAALEPALAARCANAGGYVEPDPNVSAFAPWPDAPGGRTLRVYPLDAHPPEPGRLGRIFRCTTLMVNVFEPDDEPRDPAKLSPHHHDDFEQMSLQIHGDYVHHMRVPWTPDSTTWRDDEHRACTGPAVVVIPPPLVHTSQSVGTMRHWLIDAFAPPRRDFSERPGWVLNADDYPTP